MLLCIISIRRWMLAFCILYFKYVLAIRVVFNVGSSLEKWKFVQMYVPTNKILSTMYV